MSKSLMRVHHPASVRSVAFSPSLWQPLQAIVGLDNGSIYRYSILVVIKPVSTPNVRWDLKMGQRGLLDRLLVAHTTPVTSLSWRESPGINGSETGDNGMGWFASGGLDRCVKVNRCIRTSCHLLSTHIGMGSKCTGLQFPHTSQADLHTSSTIPCATCSMATGV